MAWVMVVRDRSGRPEVPQRENSKAYTIAR